MCISCKSERIQLPIDRDPINSVPKCDKPKTNGIATISIRRQVGDTIQGYPAHQGGFGIAVRPE